MARSVVLAAVVVVTYYLQQSCAYKKPEACKTLPWVLSPKEEASQPLGNCFNTQKEVMYFFAMTVVQQVCVFVSFLPYELLRSCVIYTSAEGTLQKCCCCK